MPDKLVVSSFLAVSLVKPSDDENVRSLRSFLRDFFDPLQVYHYAYTLSMPLHHDASHKSFQLVRIELVRYTNGPSA